MDVRAIQMRLSDLGFNPGVIDGLMGPNTRKAVARFQVARAIVGDIGPLTEAALFPVVSPVPQDGMKTSAFGRAAISQREGVRLEAYRDSVGVWTIGVGHTSAAGPPTVTPDLRISSSDCDDILSCDLKTFERAVNDVVTTSMSQNQFDACVSLAFNIGGGAFKNSSVVRKLNAGDVSGAADAFLMWNKAGGRILKGLTTRRQSERKQFLAP
jgi:lysozyme